MRRLRTRSGAALAQGLARGVAAPDVRSATVTGLREVPGHGVEGTWHGLRVRFGRAD